MADYIITKTPKFFEKIGDYNFANITELESIPDTIAFDSETTGLSSIINDMFCVQIGTGKDNYIVHMYDNNYNFSEVIPYLKGKTLVLQNALFDLGFMYKHNFFPENILDTMLASKILYNGKYEKYQTKKGLIPLPMRHDFGSIMKKQLGVVYDKTDQKNIHLVKLSQASAIKYSFNDVDRLLELHDVLYKKIVSSGALETYKLHCRFIRALAYIERCGLPISPEKWLHKMKIDESNVVKQRELIEEYIHDNIPKFADNQLDFFRVKKEITVKITSPKQMVSVFNELGIATKDKDGNDSIKEDIINKTKHEFVDIWLDFQEANHRVTTFGKSIYDKIINNRIYSNFNPMVDTARLSSRRGTINFLNFPRDGETRSCFEAHPGNVMVVCDWSGQETVIAADVSGDAAMTKSVVEGADLHCLLARVLHPELASLTDKEIKTHHDGLREASKAPRFAMQYGGNAYTLHVNGGIPMIRAQEIEDSFKELHEGLYSWGAVVFEEAIKVGYIVSVDGWRLYLPRYDEFKKLRRKVESISREQWSLYKLGKEQKNREYMIRAHNLKLKPGGKPKEFIITDRKAFDFYVQNRKLISNYFKLRSEYQRLSLNNPIQTRGSHQMKLALSMLFEWILDNDLIGTVLMCNAIHDEIVAECPEEYSDIVTNLIGDIMVEAGNHYLKTLEIKADAAPGSNWFNAKKG